MLNKFKKLSLFKKLGIIFIAALVFLGIMGAITDIITDQKDEEPIAEKPEEKKEPEKPKEKPEKKKEPEEVDHTDLSEDNLKELHEGYKYSFIDEFPELIIKIEPKSEDYREVNVMLDENVFNMLDDNEKQIFVDKVGSEVENYTRVMIYKTPVKDFLYVYFVNDKFENLVKTGHFDKGWKVK